MFEFKRTKSTFHPMNKSCPEVRQRGLVTFASEAPLESLIRVECRVLNREDKDESKTRRT